MPRSYQTWLILGVLVLSFVVIPVGSTEGQKYTKLPSLYSPYQQPEAPAADSSPVCQVYALADLGADPALAKWVAETIPHVIEPGSWSQDGSGKHKLTYSASAKVLVVCHTPSVQAKVETFLDAMKKGLAMAKQAEKSAPGALKAKELIPAQYVVPQNVAPMSATQQPESSYPVAAPKKAPKHLFHFIIRYEGDGIIDSNVVEFMKAQLQQNATSSSPTSGNAPACLVPPSGGPYGIPASGFVLPTTGTTNTQPIANSGPNPSITVPPATATTPQSPGSSSTAPGPKATSSSPTDSPAPKNNVPKGLDGTGT